MLQPIEGGVIGRLAQYDTYGFVGTMRERMRRARRLEHTAKVKHHNLERERTTAWREMGNPAFVETVTDGQSDRPEFNEEFDLMGGAFHRDDIDEQIALYKECSRYSWKRDGIYDGGTQANRDQHRSIMRGLISILLAPGFLMNYVDMSVLAKMLQYATDLAQTPITPTQVDAINNTRALINFHYLERGSRSEATMMDGWDFIPYHLAELSMFVPQEEPEEPEEPDEPLEFEIVD